MQARTGAPGTTRAARAPAHPPCDRSTTHRNTGRRTRRVRDTCTPSRLAAGTHARHAGATRRLASRDLPSYSAAGPSGRTSVELATRPPPECRQPVRRPRKAEPSTARTAREKADCTAAEDAEEEEPASAPLSAAHPFGTPEILELALKLEHAHPPLPVRIGRGQLSTSRGARARRLQRRHGRPRRDRRDVRNTRLGGRGRRRPA